MLRLSLRTSGKPSPRCCRRSRPSPRVVDRASPTGLPLAVSSSSCAQDAPGGCCRRSSAAAAAQPAGDGSATGGRPASGRSCTRGCWTGWATRRPSTGAAPASTARASGPKGGRGDRAEPDRPRQARLQVPPRRRQEGYPPRRLPLGGQRPRRDPAAPPGRPDPADHRAAGTAGAAPEAPGQAARRQGVRCFDPAPCAAGSRHHAADRAAGDRLERAAGPAPLGGRAHPGLAARLPPARGSVRAASEPAPGPAAPGVRAGLRPVPRPVNGWRVQPDGDRDRPVDARGRGCKLDAAGPDAVCTGRATIGRPAIPTRGDARMTADRPLSRRRLLQQGGTGLTAALATGVTGVAAQEATPGGQTATPVGSSPVLSDVALGQFEADVEAALGTFRIVGAAVALVDGSGIRYQRGFGVRDQASGEPVTPDTHFLVASTTKSMSSLLVATFVDDGTLSWDQPVHEVWADFRAPTAELTNTLRVRDLLGMDSGIGEPPSVSSFHEGDP